MGYATTFFPALALERIPAPSNYANGRHKILNSNTPRGRSPIAFARSRVPAPLKDEWRRRRYLVESRTERLKLGGRAVVTNLRGHTVVFYPQVPSSRSAIYRACLEWGARISNNPAHASNATIVFRWQNATRWKADDVLRNIAATRHVVNIDCDDISKNRVNDAFAKAFGYCLGVDPLVYEDLLVEKSDDNATHDGRVLKGPLLHRQAGRSYQRFVDGLGDDRLTRDLRITVVGRLIPYVQIRTRANDERFASDFAHISFHAPEELMDAGEQAAVVRFTQLLNLEVGELDAIRDRKDGRLYIVDANNTPWWVHASSYLSPEERRLRLSAFLAALYLQFVRTPQSGNRASLGAALSVSGVRA
jgi:hypothetical protein